MNNIHFLKPSVYQKITAGEIIENPASIIQELLDNSIDAKATQIKIWVNNGGKSSISILDNGIGMSKEDLLICYHKYSTSKISHFEDIYKISSLGFRGEALNSISSVSELTIQSKDNHTPIGYSIRLKFNELVQQEEISMKNGTFLKVKNLFGNIPIRKMHLKLNQSELNRIKTCFIKKALPFNDIKFKLFNNDKLIHNFEKTKQKIDRIAIIQEDLDVHKNLISIKYRNPELKIEAYISKVHFYKNKKDIHFYFNNRHTQNLNLHKAVLQAYEKILPIGKYPIAYFFIYMPQHLLDINVHPSKKEIRIFVEFEIHKTIKKLIENHLIESPQVPKFKISKLRSSSNAISKEEKLLRMEISKRENQIGSQEKDLFHHTENNEDHHTLSGFPLLLKNISEGRNPNYKILAQLFRTYILIEYENEFILIDQHALHEILNYLKIKSKFLNRELETQYLIHPVEIKIDPSDYKILQKEKIKKTLEKNLGLHYEILTSNRISIESLPFFIHSAKIKEALDHIIQLIQKKNNVPTPTEFLDTYIKMQSCKNSIKSGDIMDEIYFNQIITELSSFKHHFSCPHGRPIAVEINQNNLEKLFLRS